MDPNDHHAICGMLKQFSLTWETAVFEWADKDHQCANLVDPETGKIFRAQLIEWADSTFPPVFGARLDKAWSKKTWDNLWNQFNKWNERIATYESVRREWAMENEGDSD